MHLYSSRSLTEKDMLVYVQENKQKKRKETTRLYNGRKKDDTSQVKEEGKKTSLTGFLTIYVSLMSCLFDKRNPDVSTSMLQVAIVHSLHCIQKILKNKKF